MQSSINIENKLALFYKKYYKNELIKGCIFFFSLGVLYLIITIYVESLLWLKPINRFVLFWLFIVIELLFFYKFILIPIIKLFKNNKHNVLFVYTANVLKGIVHFADYNRNIVLKRIQDDMLNFEMNLRECLVLNGKTNQSIIEYLEYRFNKSKYKNDKEVWFFIFILYYMLYCFNWL